MHHLDPDVFDQPKPPTGPHVQAQVHYYEMRRRHDVAKRTATEAYRAMKEAERKLVEVMMDMGLSNLDYMDDGSKVSFRGDLNISVTQDNEAEVREWLRTCYGDDTPFEQVKLDKKGIKDQIKKDLAAGDLSETEVPATLKLSQFPGLSVYGWKEP